ncbi:hypothetical protein E6Q11_00550 [Candidatus Dojkabacteria bacterium]|uniref:Uncharacterized protein n=1 Tax=Candidatus Dojkabacteria bacterium TaxID=2099670 RepID=A0A5C7JB13_9BACT|nr:MAG: hypothetical protein E6Q11_00550 [Candidatus Dojkabacteria bacterium]
MRETLRRISSIVTPRTASHQLAEARALGIQIKTPAEMAELFEERTIIDFGMTGAEFRAAHAAGTLPDHPYVRHDAMLGGIIPVEQGTEASAALER